MAATPPVPGVVKCVLQGVCAAIPVANVFHMGYTGQPPTGAQCDGLAQVMANSYAANLVPHLSSDMVMNFFQVIDLSSEVGSAAVIEVSHPGGISGQAAPNNCAVVISKEIARRYRGGHPRTYICGGLQSQINTETTWNASYATQMANAWAAFIQGMIGTVSWPQVLEEVVVHYVKNHLPLANPLVDATVGAVARTTLGTMRRRLS